MAVTTIGEVRSPYKTMQDWSFGFSGCIWSHLWPMCIVLCCVSHASLSLHAEFQVQRGFILAAAPGFDVPGSQGMHQERLCPTGKAWAQVPGHSPHTRHTGNKIRQMKEFCYSNDLAQYLASRQLNKPLWDMATELWLPLYLSSKGTFCSSEDSQWIPPLMLCSYPLLLNYHPFNPSGYENRSSAWPLPLQ